jgi:hypothetical protein
MRLNFRADNRAQSPLPSNSSGRLNSRLGEATFWPQLSNRMSAGRSKSRAVRDRFEYGGDVRSLRCHARSSRQHGRFRLAGHPHHGRLGHRCRCDREMVLPLIRHPLSKGQAIVVILLLSLALWAVILGLFMAIRHALTLAF